MKHRLGAAALCVCSTILVGLLFVFTALAQSDAGAITGYVRDPTGSVVPNAR